MIQRIPSTAESISSKNYNQFTKSKQAKSKQAKSKQAKSKQAILITNTKSYKNEKANFLTGGSISGYRTLLCLCAART
jgi:hypothetical protein